MERKMKLSRSLLLGSAASLVVAVGAQAADIPSRKAAPVQYVKICDAYGAGFFYIPGTDTCLRVGGYVRAEYQYTPGQAIRSIANGAVTQVSSAQDQTGMEMRGRIDVDARTQTAWGTVQTVVNLRGTNTDGIRNSSSTVNFGTAYVPQGNGSSSLTMERGFIRFAGITAGVATENFVAAPGYLYFAPPWAKFSNGAKQLAYTATFGGGFSATLAVESRGDFPYNSVSGTTVVSATPTAVNSTYVSQWDTGYNLVGNVRYDQGWGFVQLSGALGNNSTSTAPSASYNPLLGPEKYGAYAIGGTIRVNLPMLAAGDQIYLIGTYAHGMDGLVLTGGTSSLGDGDNKRLLGGIVRNDSNLFVTSVNSSGTPEGFGTENAWQIGTLFTHYWAPQWRSNFAVGYVHFDPPTASCSTVSAGACVQNSGLNTQLGQADIWDANGSIIWSPTSNFDIGLELAYAHIKQTIQNPTSAFISAGQPGLSEDNWGTKLRLERTF
jgi:hypothetical protein